MKKNSDTVSVKTLQLFDEIINVGNPFGDIDNLVSSVTIQPFNLYAGKFEGIVKGRMDVAVDEVWFEFANSLEEAFQRVVQKRKTSRYQNTRDWNKLPFIDGQYRAVTEYPKPGARFYYNQFSNGLVRFGVRNKK